jgi:hypothetical protein
MTDKVKKASLAEIKAFFGMTNAEMMAEWKEVDADDRDYFKIAVGKEIHGEVS